MADNLKLLIILNLQLNDVSLFSFVIVTPIPPFLGVEIILVLILRETLRNPAKELIGIKQWFIKSTPPVSREPRTGNLHKDINPISKLLQLLREYLRYENYSIVYSFLL